MGEDGVRCYTAPPLTHNDSGLARRQARVWADEDARLSLTTVAFIGWAASQRTGRFEGSWEEFDKVALDVAAPEVEVDEPGNE